MKPLILNKGAENGEKSLFSTGAGKPGQPQVNQRSWNTPSDSAQK